jgi:hypothetical protein
LTLPPLGVWLLSTAGGDLLVKPESILPLPALSLAMTISFTECYSRRDLKPAAATGR